MRSSFKTPLSIFSSLALALVACQSEAPSAQAPDGGAAAEDPGQIDEPTDEPGDVPSEEAPAECGLTKSWDGPVSTICSAATASCIEKAKTGAAVSKCIQSDSGCSDCFSEVVSACLVGTPAKPGVCAGKAGCVDSCIATACGAHPTDACVRNAVQKGACKGVSDDLQKCFDEADQTKCVERFRQECVPKPSCGNGIVDGTETCDGNCPTSCPAPPPGDQCTVSTLKGNAATCSSLCETQSTCPAQCPTNATPLLTVGTITSGTTLPAKPQTSWPSLASMQAHGCPSILAASSHVVSWRAPAAGRYTFRATCDVTWTEYEKGTGHVFEHGLDCVRRIAIAHGKQCASGVEPFACALDLDNAYQQSLHPDVKALAPLDLAAGDELLIAVDFGVSYLPPADTNNTYGGHASASSWSVSVSSCVPQCSGKACGSDGCGGTCGICGAGQTCNASGQCQAVCVPQCAGKACGSDGCGGSCGFCGAGQTCNGSGQCQAACVPQCAGKSCGSNGCGGTCGTCSGAKTCNASGQCQLTGPCDPVSNVGCTAPNQCITLSNETNQCALMGTGGQGSSCATSADCKGGHGCFAGTCRKICDRTTGEGCGFGQSCAPVAGWVRFGTCTN